MLPTTTTTKYTSSGQISTSRTFLLDDDHNNANLKANIGGCNNNNNNSNSNSKNRSNSNSSTRKTIANSFNSSTNNINNHNHYRHHHYKQQNNNKNIVDGNNLSNNCRSDEVLVVIDEHTTTTTTTPNTTTPKSKNAEVEVEEELELILASNKPQPIDTTTNCKPNITTTTNNNQRNISLTTTTNNTNNTTTKSVSNCKNNKQTDVVRLTNRYCSLNNITENNAENSSRHIERPEDPIKSFYFNLSDLEDRPPTRTSANSCYCSSSSNSSSATGCIGCCSNNISTTSNTSNQTTSSGNRTTTNQRSLSILDKYSTKQREFNAARKYHQLEKLLLLSLSSSSLVSSSSLSSSSNRSAFSPATATNSSSSSSSTSPPLSSSSNTDTTSASTSSSLFLVPPNRLDTYRLGDIIPTAVVQPTTVNSILPPPAPTYDDVPIVYVSKKSICLENSIKTSSGGNQAQRYHLRKQVSLTNLPSSTSSNNTTSGIGTISTISDTTSSSSTSSNTNLSTNTVVKIPKIAAAKSELLLSQAAVNTKQHTPTNEQKQAKEETKEIVIKNSNRYTTPSSQTKQTANILNNPTTTSEEKTSCNTTATPNNSSSGGGGGEAGGGGGGSSDSLGSGISRATNDTLEPIVSIVKELETNIKSTLMNQQQNQNTNMMNLLPQISTNNNRTTTKDLQQKTSGEDTTNRIHTTSSKDKVAIPILKPPICNIVNNSNTSNTKKSKTYTVNNSETSTTVLASSIETDKTKIITFNAALIQQKSLLKKYNPPIKIPTHPNDDIHQQGTNSSLLSVYEFDDNLVLSSHVDKLVAAMTDERPINESNKKASNPVTNNSSNTAENSNSSKFNPVNSISSDNKCTTATVNGANNCQFIVSRHGTVRGSLNHVKTSLKQIFKEPHITSPVVNPQLNITPSNNYYNYNCATVNTKVNEKLLSHYYLARNYEEEEDKKIVIYTTSLQIVRLAYDKCKRVKKILQNHCVRYEERDLYKNREYQRELKYRLNINQVDVPHVFFNGKHVGNCDQLELYSDQGVLNELFKDLEKIKLRIYCSKCGGYRFVLCTLCNGSKKKFNNFTNLKCTACNEDGLVRCSECLDQQE